MKYLIVSLIFLVGCSTPKPRKHVMIDLNWEFMKARSESGAVIVNEKGRPMKRACLAREEYKKWKLYQIKNCKEEVE